MVPEYSRDFYRTFGLFKSVLSWIINTFITKSRNLKSYKFDLPTAGDIDLEPVEPVGEGVGLQLGVPGAGPFELSLLFCPDKSCKKKINVRRKYL